MQKVLGYLKAYTLPLLAGAILPLAFAPFNQLWALFASLLLLLVKLDGHLNQATNQSKKAALRSGFIYWLGFYLSGVSWVYVSIHVYGYTPAPIAAMLALLFALGLAFVSSLQWWVYTRFNLHRLYLITLPASWVLIEWFRSWFLTGFPWLYNGYAFIDSPLSVFAPIGGVYLLSFLSILIACSLFFSLKILYSRDLKKIKLIPIGLVAPILILACSVLLPTNSWISVTEDRAVQVHLVQGNISQHDKWLPENQRHIIRAYHDLISETLDSIEVEQTKNQLDSNNSIQNIIVLPEAAMPTLQSHIPWFFDELGKRAKALNVTLISGIFYDEPQIGEELSDVYNSIYATGAGSGLYHKQRLVPFGEYVPFEDFIRGMIPFFDLPYSSFTRGHYGQEGLLAGDIKIAPFICYEILYPKLVFDHAKNSDLLLTISNDAWFGNSTGPEQHFQMARMRALEHGKYLIRTTNTGTTAIIDYQGKVTHILEKNKRAVLSADAYLTEGATPYSEKGHQPWIALCMLILALATALEWQRKVKQSDKTQA